MKQPVDNGFTEVVQLIAQARQFFEGRMSDAIVSPLVRQPWTHKLLNLAGVEGKA